VNKEEFESLKDAMSFALMVHVTDFTGPDRTLLYGYTCDRDTFHIYLKDGYIHRLVYTYDGEVKDYGWHKAWHPERMVPDKRVYPESTDIQMAYRLQATQVSVPYLPFTEATYSEVCDRQFHGKTKEEL
jgi:hypothetical protein